MKILFHKAGLNISLIIFLTILGQSAKCQVQNSIAFDGVDDKVVASAASSLIANSTGMSLSCWVYPTNAAPVFPNFDSFVSFRNDANADFYLVQVTATDVECRFRNSTGTSFDITDHNLVLNTWQHYVCTYDGVNLIVYRNGVLTQSVPATGVISNTAVDLMIGDQIYSITHFLLTGKVDEVTLWNRAITAQEVACMYNGNVDNSDPNLKLHYKFNQGVANGNNAGLNTLIDSKGTLNATLFNFALTGTASNWSTGVPGAAEISANICAGESYTFGSQVLTTAGVYTDTLTSASGCDSVVTLTLSVTAIDTGVTLFSGVLHSNQSGAGYQWVDCNAGFSPIAGATSQNYTVTATGSYAVIVTKNGCADTSSCHLVTLTGIQENNLLEYVHIYPNPVTDFLSVNLDGILHTSDIEITDIEGRIMYKDSTANITHLNINVGKWANGIYILKVTSPGGTATVNFQKH